MRDLVIQDTCEVILEDLVSKDKHNVGYAQISSIEQTTDSTDLRGGIGNKLAYLLRTSKDIALQITSATFKPEFLSLISGDRMKDITEEVSKVLYLSVTDNAGAKEIKLPTAQASLTAVRVEDVDGTQHDLVPTAGVIDASTLQAEAGDDVDVYYLEDITGKGIEFDAEKFGNKYKITYRTVGYDRELAKITTDIYFIFDEAIPEGAFSMQLQNGEVYIPEMNFRVTPPTGSSKLGRTIYKERA